MNVKRYRPAVIFLCFAVIIAWVTTDFSNALNSCDWPTELRTPDNNRIVPVECAPKTDKPVKLWSTKLDGQIRSTCTLADGRLFIMTSSPRVKLYCLDAYSGSYLWDYDMSYSDKRKNCRIASATISDGKVYLTSGDKGVVCLDAKTGFPVWQRIDTSPNSSPLVYNNNVVVVDEVISDENKCEVLSIKSDNGDIESRDTIDVANYYEECNISTAPVEYNDLIYIHNNREKLYCFDPVLGLITKEIKLDLFIYTAPILSGDRCFVLTCGTLICLNMDDWKPIWKFESELIDDPIYCTSPLLDNDRIYITSLAHGKMMRCIDANTGNEIWQNSSVYGVESNCTMVGNKIFVPSNNRGLMCVDKNDGKILWINEELKGMSGSAPVVAYNRIYIATKDGTVYCLGDPPCGENENDSQITFNGGSKKWQVCGVEQKPLPVAVEIQNGVPFIPFSSIAKIIGVEVAWDKDTKRMTITRSRDGKRVVVWAGYNMAIVDGIEVALDKSNKEITPYIIGGRMMLPAGFVCNSLKLIYSWNHDLGKVSIIYKH